MIALRIRFARYCRDRSGAYAVLFALAVGFIVMAAHIGVDAMRVQNASTAAEQTVDIACQKIATADPALYPTADALKDAIEKQMAARRVSGADTTDGTFTVTKTATDSTYVTPIAGDGSYADLRRHSFTVSYQGKVGQLHKDLVKGGKADVAVAKPCKPVCPGMNNVIYSNSVALGHWMDKGTLKAAQRVDKKGNHLPPFEVVDFADGYNNPGSTKLVLTIRGAEAPRPIRLRKIVNLPGDSFYIDNDRKVAPGQPPAGTTRYVAEDTDQIFLQALNADGSLPGLCDVEKAPTCTKDCDKIITCPNNDCPPLTTVDVCKFDGLPDLDSSYTPLDILDFKSKKVEFFYPQNGDTGRLVLTWLPPEHRSITIRLAPFYVQNPTPVKNRFANNEWHTLSREAMSAIGYTAYGRYRHFNNAARRYLVHLTGTSWTYWWDGDSLCTTYATPIVFDTRGLGSIMTTRVDGQKADATDPLFDYFGRGKKVHVEWPIGEGQAWLVDNRDGRAETDMSGRRFFGNLGGYEDGYAKLIALDTSGTGILAGRDLEGLALWFDNGNAIVEPGELRSVIDAGVTAIDARGVWQTLPDGRGVLRASATMSGWTIMTEDISIDITTPAVKSAQQFTKKDTP